MLRNGHGIAFYPPSVTKDYFEWKSSLLIKRMKGRRPVEQRASACALAAAMKEFSDKTQKPLMGLTLGRGQELAE